VGVPVALGFPPLPPHADTTNRSEPARKAADDVQSRSLGIVVLSVAFVLSL
jgi:hypothetical protein